MPLVREYHVIFRKILEDLKEIKMKLFRRYLASAGLVVFLIMIAGTGVVSAQVSGEIEDVRVDHNVFEDGVKGMRIHVSFTAHNMRGSTGHIAAYFYFQNGRALNDFNDRFSSVSGQVSVGSDFTPRYADSVYNDFQLFMPYDELHLADGEHQLQFDVVLFHELGNGYTEFARFDDVTFRATIGIVRIELDAGFVPDPHAVVIEVEGEIAASTLGRGCRGYVTSHHNAVLDWDGYGGMLRFYLTSSRDTVMVIEDPDGNIYCSDDSFDTVQPTITLQDAEDGEYKIWVGTYFEDEVFNATLNITELSSQHP